MPNIPNFGNVAKMGEGGTNIFEHRAVRRFATKIMRKANAKAAAPKASAPAQSGGSANPAPNASMGEQMRSGRANRQARAMGISQPRSTSQASGKAPSFAPQRTANTAGHRAPSFGPPSPSNTPFSNAQRGVPTHVAPPIAVNPFSHGPGSSAPQVNSAPKPSINPFQAPAAATPASTPTHHGTSSAQFVSAPEARSLPHAAVNVGSNSPFPTHVHPEGSSTQILRNTSATESAKGGAPNTFTVGSRNVKSGGIAAMGSRLEAGLNARPLSTPERKRRV